MTTIVSGSTILIVSTTGAASTAPRPGRTSRMPARTSSARTSGRAPSCTSTASQRSGDGSQCRERRSAGATRRRRTTCHAMRGASCRDDALHRFDPLGFGDHDEVVDLGHAGKRANRPARQRQAARAAATAWGGRNAFRGRPRRRPRPTRAHGTLQCGAPSRFGRAKIMRPATVCRTLVTTTSVSSPISRRPCSTTIIVPSSR